MNFIEQQKAKAQEQLDSAKRVFVLDADDNPIAAADHYNIAEGGVLVVNDFVVDDNGDIVTKPFSTAAFAPGSWAFVGYAD